MKIKIVSILMVFLFLLASIKVCSQRIYISPSGSDSNDGTIDNPFASLTRARDRAREIRKNIF